MAYWQDKLDPKYHCFAGNYHNLPVPCKDFHRFEGTTEPPFARPLLLAPPAVGESVVFMNDDNYAMRLIGLVRSKFWIVS